ncbi:universal stress protein [Streptomyces sp. MUM 203J]|uniref:universal stress protein n=1 Tax=Streptomyces sp. MUM 203J TaxID=2791990 RepID=UPI001F03A126|nr:universal stress protein [Streptomyces sp. MUM 203J]MCH0541001.1 universal stress protein [Streptomyces sp. MUM 203J]
MGRPETERLIVVGVDGPESGRPALRSAARRAALTGSGPRPVQVRRLPPAHGMPVDCSDVDLTEQTRQSPGRTIEGVLGKHAEVPVDPRVVEGHPAAVPAEASRDAGPPVVGGHRRRAFTGTLLGSVSGRCVHHADCPVLVVRSDRR